jgi:hypothetical protein
MSKRKGPSITFTDTGVHVEHRGRVLDLPVYESEDADALIALDGVTHYGDGTEIELDDLNAILEAIEEAAEEDGLTIEFD